MNILKPDTLRPGDTIGIVAPAGPVTKKAITRAKKYLASRGYQIVLGKHLFKKRGYLAGSDRERAADINAMFAAKKVRAIICARGGYGTIRLLDRLDYGVIRRNPKILVGFSDITALQQALWARTGLVTFYGSMATIDLKLNMNRFTEKHLWRMLTGGYGKGADLAGRSDWKIYKKGQCRGRILGGCFSLLYPLIGTPYQPDFRDTILVFEDIDEDPYLIDKGLHQMKHAGILKQLKGLVIGKMTRCIARKKPTLTLEQVIRDMVSNINGPVVTGLDFGHTLAKLTVPLGVWGAVDTRKKTFTLLEKPVQ